MPDISDEVKEVRAIYDIRVKELHHYGTTVWAFPGAFAALLAAEHRFLAESPKTMVCAALFNMAMCYTFWKHLYNRDCVLKAAKCIEAKFADAYGKDFVPQFRPSPWYLKPRAPTVMKFTVTAITLAFLLHALFLVFGCLAPDVPKG